MGTFESVEFSFFLNKMKKRFREELSITIYVSGIMAISKIIRSDINNRFRD
jgi:hypothetical protein